MDWVVDRRRAWKAQPAFKVMTRANVAACQVSTYSPPAHIEPPARAVPRASRTGPGASRAGSAHPCRTPRGTSWTNRTVEVVGEDRPVPTCHRCQQEGNAHSSLGVHNIRLPRQVDYALFTRLTHYFIGPGPLVVRAESGRGDDGDIMTLAGESFSQDFCRALDASAARPETREDRDSQRAGRLIRASFDGSLRSVLRTIPPQN